MQMRAPLPAPHPEDNSKLFASAFSARAALGVDALEQKHDGADGRGVKIAIFDTGISTQIPGLEPTKIFDLSDFGRLQPTPLAPGDIFIFRGPRPPVLKGESWLREKDLARAAAQSRGADINHNRRIDDSFRILTGEDEHGENRIWIDFNQDGIFDRQTEELGDYNSGLRADASMPLAVSIFSDSSLQFHVAIEGHGTACASVIRGTSRHRGLAPAAEIYSYVLDPAGENLNSIEDLLKIFLHARNEGVDLINVSWNFTTADLASARFFADFVDNEIISAGIGVAFAAGNDGPGNGTASAADYVPHRGFGVGARVLPEIARGVYGWSGDLRSADAWFSSRGPTRGGRIMPDVFAPFMNLAQSAPLQNVGLTPFDGTSSATPAFIGATAALWSLLRQKYPEKIQILALKRALQNSTHDGVPHMERALALYETLRRESTESNYELRAETALSGEQLPGEGVRLSPGRSEAEVFLRVIPSSARALAAGEVEELELRFENAFFEAPSNALLQAPGLSFRVATRPETSHVSGLLEDILSVRRRRDGLELLKIPVTFERPWNLSPNAEPFEISMQLGPQEVFRRLVQLDQRQSLHFAAELDDVEAAGSGHLVAFLRDAQGRNIFKSFSPLRAHAPQIRWSSPEIPAGVYEISIFRTFDRGARLRSTQLHATIRGPFVRVLGQRRDVAYTSVAIEAAGDINIERAQLSFSPAWSESELLRRRRNERESFSAELSLGTKSAVLDLELIQNDFDASTEAILSTEIIVSDAGSKEVLYRGWLGLGAGPPQTIYLKEASDQLHIEAYPNIVRWPQLQTQTLKIRARPTLEKSAPMSSRPGLSLLRGQRAVLRFSNADIRPDADSGAHLELFDSGGQSLGEIPFAFR